MSPWPLLCRMKSSLLLLLLLVSGVAAWYWESHSQCQQVILGPGQDFVGLNATLPPSLGVCDWEVKVLTDVAPDNWLGWCASCRLTSSPHGQGLAGCRLYPLPLNVAPRASCKWTGCFEDQPCSAGEIEAESALCGGTRTSRLCCPLKPYYLCCQASCSHCALCSSALTSVALPDCTMANHLVVLHHMPSAPSGATDGPVCWWAGFNQRPFPADPAPCRHKTAPGQNCPRASVWS